MEKLNGKASDRIRNNPPQGARHDRLEADDRPRPDAVRNARGFGLGQGATRRRSAE